MKTPFGKRLLALECKCYTIANWRFNWSSTLPANVFRSYSISGIMHYNVLSIEYTGHHNTGYYSCSCYATTLLIVGMSHAIATYAYLYTSSAVSLKIKEYCNWFEL